MRIQTIKEGNVVLPKDHNKMTVQEYYFVLDYIKVINAAFKEITHKKSYRSQMKRLVKKAKSK